MKDLPVKAPDIMINASSPLVLAARRLSREGFFYKISCPGAPEEYIDKVIKVGEVVMAYLPYDLGIIFDCSIQS